MLTKCRLIATFHRPIHSHWSLPLNEDPDENRDQWFIGSPGLHFEPPGLHCERPRPSVALFWASEDSEFWPFFNVDPKPEMGITEKKNP